MPILAPPPRDRMRATTEGGGPARLAGAPAEHRAPPTAAARCLEQAVWQLRVERRVLIGPGSAARTSYLPRPGVPPRRDLREGVHRRAPHGRERVGMGSGPLARPAAATSSTSPTVGTTRCSRWCATPAKWSARWGGPAVPPARSTG